MATTIRIKRRVTGAAGAPAALKSAELAHNEVDSVLYIGKGDDGSGNATSSVPIGGAGAFVALTGAQTVAGAKTFTVVPKSSQDAAGATDLVRKSQLDAAVDGKQPLSNLLTSLSTFYTIGGTITPPQVFWSDGSGVMSSSSASPFMLGALSADTAAAARSTLGFTGLNVNVSGNYGFGSGAISNYRIVVDLAQDDTTTTGSQISGKVTLTADGTTVGTGVAGIGIVDQSTFNNTFASYSARGAFFQGYANGVSGTVDTVCGVYGMAGNSGAGTVTNASAFVAFPLNNGGGVVDTFYGFQVPATTLANKVRAFRSSIASGTDRWNFFANGTAANAFAGASRFGSVVAPVNTVDITGSFGRGAPVTKTAAFALAATENWIICNGSGSITVTLPAASSWTGREVMIKTIAAQTVVSASSNVVPLAGGAAGTAILAATAGKWATLVSNGTNWVIMAGN